jgi:murein DD-endopeptidase MepM/ murein hydrolase activator NlpD
MADVKVKSGDTLSAIAAKNNVSVAAIAAANPQISNLNLIRPGQIVTIPTVTANKTSSNTYAGGVTGGTNPFAANSGVSAAKLETIAAAAGVTPTTGVTGTTDSGFIGSPESRGLSDRAVSERQALEEAARLKAEQDAARLKAEQDERDRKAKEAADALAAAQAALVAAQAANNAIALAQAQAALAAAQAAAIAAAAAAATTTTAATTANAAATAAATAAAEAEKIAAQRESIGKIVADRFAQYGLSSLGNKILEFARLGYTEATITLELQKTDEYKARFSANTERQKKGLSVLSPAEYLSVEDGYRQTLRAYGLNQFDNDTYVKQFIANDMSPSELSSRVVTAVQRVQNADPLISRTLRDYYGISNIDMVAYVLDPNNQLPKIQRQVAAAEIGSAARLQGLEAGVSVSEQLASQGITQAEAQKGYATIADILPTSEKLSSIYGTQLPGYGQAEAEQEVFNTLASAQRKRRALSEAETGQFSTKSGLSRTSLTNRTGGQY